MKALSSRDPKKIGDFTIVSRLGAGGMGDVYLGERDGENVAIKVIRDSFADDPSYVARFTREITILQTVSHPNVIGFVDSGLDDGRWWYASEFAHGPSLDAMVKKSGPLSEDAWEVLASGLLAGLNAIHGHNIVHRDIKPANIIMSPYGPKIIDLGVARGDDETSLTNSGMAPGSPAWFSPEQVLGQEVTTASDYFSAGAVLTYAATGQGPWGAPSSVSYENIGTKIFSTPDLTGLSDVQHTIVEPLLRQDPFSRQLPEAELFATDLNQRMPAQPDLPNLRGSGRPQDPFKSSGEIITMSQRDFGNQEPEVPNAEKFESRAAREKQGRQIRLDRKSLSLSVIAAGAILSISAMLFWSSMSAPDPATSTPEAEAVGKFPIEPIIIRGEIWMPTMYAHSDQEPLFKMNGDPCVPFLDSSPRDEEIQLVATSGEVVGRSRVIGYDLSAISQSNESRVATLSQVQRENLGNLSIRVSGWTRQDSCVYTYSFLNPTLDNSSYNIRIGSTRVGRTFSRDEIQSGVRIFLRSWGD